MIDPLNALAFSLFENRGVYALLLGSGLSRAASIPTGWEITLDLTRRLAELEGAGDQADWSAWHQERFGEPPSYSVLMDALACTPAERRALLHSYIEPSAEDIEAQRRTPTAAHHSIARLVRDGFVRVIVTTNFDRLLETALRAAGVEPSVIRSDDDLAGAVPLAHARCSILKVHGDYLDTRLRNTEGELAAYGAAQDALLDRIFDEHGLIVCGWSADWDPALRDALSRTPSRRYPLYWASRGDPSGLAADLIAHRHGAVVPIESADSFFVALQAKVEAQSILNRPHPLSIELLVAQAKKQLAKPEERIALADLVVQEIRRAKTRLRDDDFSVHVPISNDAFGTRVLAYQSVSEPLARLAFTLGRWGQGAEFPLARDLMLAFSERPSGGRSGWLDLWPYPAVLILTAYCLGAARAERHEAVLRMLKVPIHREHRAQSEAAVLRFTPEIWGGSLKSVWQTLEGMGQRIYPVCDWLHALMGAWLQDEFLASADFDLTFGWVELLMGLEFTVERIDAETLKARMQGLGGGDRFVPSPVGRMGFDSAVGSRLLTRLADEGVQTDLAQAGFAGGDPEAVAVHAENIAGHVNETRW